MEAYYADKIITGHGIENNCYLLVDEGKIIDIREEIADNIEVTSYENYYISPGYIDIHTHGALEYEPGDDDIEGLKDWCDFKIKHGVTGFLPSTTSLPLEKLKIAADNIKELMNNSPEGPNILGMQMEGPFFSRGAKIGAQNPEYVKDKLPREYKDFMKEFSDIIKYLALDPEISAAEEIVDFCKDMNIKVSAGHSEILYEDFKEIKEKYSCLTHTFNGMVGLHHRQPGLAYPACMDDELFSEIICDGFHVIYPMLELFFKLKGYEKAILITDSMAAAGMPPGTSYKLGEIEVTVSEAGKVCKEDGTLAGSTLTIEKAVQNIVNNLDIPLQQAVQMASLNPARLLGLEDSKGSLESGKDADFNVIRQNLSVKNTYIDGEKHQ